jgi:hypothetical protein
MKTYQFIVSKESKKDWVFLVPCSEETAEEREWIDGVDDLICG